MLKKRVIPMLLLKNKRMVKGVCFSNHRDTGNPSTAVRIYSAQDADELVFLDIEASLNSRMALIEVVKNAAKECFMPLSAGGGINSVEDVRQLLLAGADKVVITTSCVTQPKLVSQVASTFGNQCIVAGIDYKTGSNGIKVWIRSGTEKTNLDPLEHALFLEESGAGEILLNSIDRDGTMKGYDLEMADRISAALHIPVIIAGGAGNFLHLSELLGQTAASAAACASLFHFGDNNPIRARSFLKNQNSPSRVLK